MAEAISSSTDILFRTVSDFIKHTDGDGIVALSGGCTECIKHITRMKSIVANGLFPMVGTNGREDIRTNLTLRSALAWADRMLLGKPLSASGPSRIEVAARLREHLETLGGLTINDKHGLGL